MNYICKLFEQQEQPVISIRTRTAVSNLPQVLGKAYGSLMQYLAEAAEQPSGAPYVAYYNMDMQDLNIEVGFPVSRSLPGKDDVKPGVIAAAKHGCCTHKGPYSQMEPAYDALFKWINENGYEPTGTAYEFYLNDPETTPESELLTRISFPLK